MSAELLQILYLVGSALIGYWLRHKGISIPGLPGPKPVLPAVPGPTPAPVPASPQQGLAQMLADLQALRAALKGIFQEQSGGSAPVQSLGALGDTSHVVQVPAMEVVTSVRPAGEKGK